MYLIIHDFIILSHNFLLLININLYIFSIYFYVSILIELLFQVVAMFGFWYTVLKLFTHHEHNYNAQIVDVAILYNIT